MRYVRQMGIFLLLLVVCSILLFSIYTDVESKTVSQVNTEQRVHAEQAAQGFLRFFATYNSTLSFLAGNNHIIAMDPESRMLIRNFYTSHSDEISSITRVDENGIILYTYPFEASTGANISGQAHVKKSIATHKVVISDIFTSVQGFRTIAFVMPVFGNGTYRGSLTILIPFDNLSEKNLGPIHILNSGYAWIISQNGNILYSPLKEQIDQSAFVVYRDSPTVSSFVTGAMKGENGTSSYMIERAPTTGEPVLYQAVYRQVTIGDAQWSIIVATPQKEILSTLESFQRDLAIISAILILSLLFFTYYITRARGIISEEAKRQAAEDALRESERNYRSILENMQDAFYRTDRDGNLIMISPSAVQLMGYGSEADILGKPLSEFYANPEERKSILEKLKESESITNIEARLRTADGTLITINANSHIMKDADGNYNGVEGVIRDITERKRTETALQVATRKLNLLTVITTTNIRNAVFTLTGYLELEQLQVDDEKRKDYHEKEGALLHQINLWLNTAKNYQDLGLNPPRWHDVNTTFILAISHLDMTAVRRTIRVEGLEVYADPLLENVFFNLTENFLLHARTATSLSMSYEETPQGLTLIFEDNGRGIPDEMKKTIFEREFTPAKGMGLFMVREILEITSISIRETGTYGKGARFEISVPREGYRFTKEKPGGNPSPR
jgi:PAS domain S-box-containing protein